jgi:hypothetical protein
MGEQMIDKVKQLNKLNNGYVAFRGDKKERHVISTPMNTTKRCEFCNKSLTGIKCIRHDKGNARLYNECFECYTVVQGVMQ